MSRPAKPTEIKKLEGNPGRRELNKAAPKFPAIAGLEPPAFLDDVARREWARVAAFLDANGILTEVDCAAFAAYCTAYSRWSHAETLLKELSEKDPKGRGLMIKGERGRPVQNPLIRTATVAMEGMLKAAQQFGMTPVSRSHVSSGSDDDDNPFEGILKDTKH